MTKQWTPEERAAHSAKLRDRHAARIAAADATAEPVANPIADDIIEAPPTPRAGRRSSPPARLAPEVFEADGPKDRPGLPIHPHGSEDSVVDSLISDLTALPLDHISFEGCGLLLNALSAASSAIALARRQKQESLAAGSHKAPCATCSRPIDISKPGGFQILTVRDEHWQPKNVYFCSQNCLLAQNMPSRMKTQKRAPGDTA